MRVDSFNVIIFIYIKLVSGIQSSCEVSFPAEGRK